ncbi:uncharacterized protein LOC131997888 [Stomoxys calcitrans]|uniref:uncharacterized protein LOC131997888 n=1 Tax=Stomoxys calcitrans TaxID=35570 RepID=UPI0027E26A19|nr:uncharacterized protein LOC131997888 [Stomoxys calcitrans]
MSLSTAIALLLLSSNASKKASENTTLPQMVNNTFVVEIVSSIHHLYQFENFVFFISPNLALNSQMAEDFLQEFWQGFPMVSSVLMINNNQSMRGFLSTSSLCMVLTTHQEDPIMNMAAASMEGVRYLKTIFIFFPMEKRRKTKDKLQEYVFFETIQLLYEWIWKTQFINTVLVTTQNNVFIQEPYPVTNVINLTAQWNVRNFFVPYRSNFKGYVVKTPLRHDPPRIFYMTRSPYGFRKNHRVSGVSGKLFMSFLSYINATYAKNDNDQLETEPVKLDRIIEMVDNQELEVSLHSYTDMLKSQAGNSYPIGINDWCIMVPYRNRSPEHLYLKKSFRRYTWWLLFLSIGYVTLAIWLCTPSESRDLGLSFVQTINSLLLIVPLKFLTLPIFRMRYMFIVLFVWGFFVSNFYLTKMASYLTASPEIPQINTYEDVIAEKLPIMVMPYEYAIMQSYNFPQAFMDLVVNASDKLEMDQHRDNFNTSYGYSTQTDRWIFENLQQRYMKSPLFRLTDMCIGPFNHVFPMLRDSHFQQPLETFILTAVQAGLMRHWERKAFGDALYLGYAHLIMVDDPEKPLTMDFFRSIWIVWWLGMVTSGLILCLEIKHISWQRIKTVCGQVAHRICNKIFGTVTQWKERI